MYINNDEFTKEIIISQGKGKLTKKAENFIIKLSGRVFGANRRMEYYKDNIFYEDLKSGGIEMGLKAWKSFNPKKYDSAFNYFTEVIKRGHTKIFNEVICNKDWKGESHPVIYFDFWTPKKD